MPYDNTPLVAFNRGLISPRGLARTDLKRTALSAEVMNNWLPHVLGSMMLRPGLGYTAATNGNNKSFSIPFIYSATDTARLELTNQILRPLVNDQPITRVSVGTAISNGTFVGFLTNPNFDSDTAWTKGAGWTITGGTAVATGAISTAISQTSGVTLVNGQSYIITYTVTRSAGTITPSIGGTAGTARNAAGTYTETIVAGATQVIAFTGAAFTGTVDTIDISNASIGWTDQDDAGSTSTILSGLTLNGTGGGSARIRQQVTVAGGDVNKEHALRIIVSRGPVMCRIGSSSGADDYINETKLGTGTHSLAFTPTGNFWVELYSYDDVNRLVTSVAVEGAGVLTLPTPWLTADLPSIRFDASQSVTWVYCYGYQQRKIERRSTTSWSIVLYEPQDGPFRLPNNGVNQLTPSANTGDITLTSSQQFFYPTHVGALFKISSIGQVVDNSFNAINQSGDSIKITGSSAAAARLFNIVISNTFVGTVKLQRSAGDVGAWQDVPGKVWTAPVTTTYNDALNGQIIYYRLLCSAYTSGTIDTELNTTQGTIDGILKVTGYTDAKTVSAAVLSNLGGTTSSALWSEGEWSDKRGWPSEVKLHEGRLFSFGYSKVWGSLPDAYESYDTSVIGDSGVINRSYGTGPQDRVQWAASLQRLLIGGAMDEWSVRSDGFDSALTPATMTIRSPSSQGGANVAAVRLDSRALFVGRSGNKLFEMNMSNEGGFIYDYTSTNLSQIAPEVTLPGIVRIGVQRHPDTRVHCVLADGTVAVLISDPSEDVTAWILFSTPFAGGLVEDVCILPGTVEDIVYYTVNRTINGSTVRYHEKFSLQMTECQGGTQNKQADCFVAGTQASSTTISGLGHLIGATVVCWADGKPFMQADGQTPATFVVSGGGTITVPTAVVSYVVGGGYTAQFKSSKLAYAAQAGSALSIKKRIQSLSVLCYNTHYQGVTYGRDFNNMMSLPLVTKGQPQVAGTIYTNYDTEKIDFPGDWDTDSRLCLQAVAPLPVTVLGAIMGLTTNG